MFKDLNEEIEIMTDTILSSIESRIKSSLECSDLQIEDQSYKHRWTQGVEGSISPITHIRITAISNYFEGKSPLERERKMVKLLSDEIKKLHSVTFTLRSIREEVNRKSRIKNVTYGKNQKL